MAAPSLSPPFPLSLLSPLRSGARAPLGQLRVRLRGRSECAVWGPCLRGVKAPVERVGKCSATLGAPWVRVGFRRGEHLPKAAVSCNSQQGKKRKPQAVPGKIQVGHQEGFFTEKAVKHWNRLHEDVLESPSLEVFKKQLVMALSAVV
ncbi:uncharacterized protein GJ701_005346 isoform 1-T1 [Geothlypis trichas]